MRIDTGIIVAHFDEKSCREILYPTCRGGASTRPAQVISCTSLFENILSAFRLRADDLWWTGTSSCFSIDTPDSAGALFSLNAMGNVCGKAGIFRDALQIDMAPLYHFTYVSEGNKELEEAAIKSFEKMTEAEW